MVVSSDLTILVVDDEVMVRMLSTDTLGEAGFTVLEASSGPEAIRVMDANDIDLIVAT